MITGLITGFIAWRLLGFLGVRHFFGISYVWLLIVVPILWILGINLGYFLGRWIESFNQFGKFAAVGFTNAAIYFGILNILIYFSDINRGVWYSVFIAIAFVVGTTHSYFWNKLWVFSSKGGGGGKLNREEFSKFFIVYVIAGLINVGIASGIVGFMSPLFELTPNQWANVGGIAGSAVALTASFIGIKLAVFKK